jgi:hypothetical protein
VDTYRCAHNGQHPYLFSFRPDGLDPTLTFLPPLVLLNVLRDVCALRNKVAHGDAIPDRWLTRNCRHTIVGQQLNYCEELLEASTGMLSLAWQTIIDGRLQAHFGTKDKMEAYFNPKTVRP